MESVKEELLKKIRDKTGITYHALERDLQQVKKEPETKTEVAVQDRIVETASGADNKQKAMRFILAAKLFSAPYAKLMRIKDLPLKDPTHAVIAEYISDCEEKEVRIRPSELFELLDENCEEFNAILNLNYGDELSGEVAERFFHDSVKTLKREAIEEEISRLNVAYKRETDEIKRKEIARKLPRDRC